MNKRYTVVGQPIAHSMSPTIHGLFGELTGRDISYTRTESTPETFSQTIRDWRDNGGLGCNITLPFKELAVELCDWLDQSATDAQAVNTISFDESGTIKGYNTDGSGLLNDLSNNQGFSINGKRVLLIGAGGAARGALGPLIEQAPTSITIANRSVDKASALASSFETAAAKQSCKVTVTGFEAVTANDQFDLVINATSLSLQGALPSLPTSIFAKHSFSYDMMYGAQPTVFMEWSQQHNAGQVCDGLGMLIEQAADAFAIWEGVRPDTSTVLKHIRDSIK